MAWTVISASSHPSEIRQAIADWEAANSPSSIDEINQEKVGRDLVSIAITYTA